MEESDFFNSLRIVDEDFEEDLQKYPKYCLLLAKPFDNMRRINLSKYEEFMNCMIHLQKHHPDRYFTDSARYKIDLTQSGEYNSIIRQMNYLFFVEFEVTNGTVSITVYLLNEPPAHYQVVYTVEFKQERSLMREKEVKYKEKGFIYTIECEVSDLSIIGDITQTEVLITLENYISCGSCEKIQKYSLGTSIYNSGWQCYKFRCIMYDRDCATSDLYAPRCETSDYLTKLQKHTHFFCPQQTTCYVCQKNFYETSFSLHYHKHHQDITYQIGEDIRIQATPGRYCLLRWSADTFLVIRYHLDNEELFLGIRSPWNRFNFDDYICSVTVSTHEQTETFTLYPLLYAYDDWKLSVGKWMFKKWNIDTEFIVFFDIQKIPSEESDLQSDDNSEDAIVLE